jgi:hypothetical protein
MKYRTMSSKQRYQLLPSVSKNTRRKKRQPEVSWTFDFSIENRRTKTNITKMWLCFYSTVLAYLPFDCGPVPDHNPTGAPIITHVMIEVYPRKGTQLVWVHTCTREVVCTQTTTIMYLWRTLGHKIRRASPRCCTALKVHSVIRDELH